MKVDRETVQAARATDGDAERIADLFLRRIAG
jgi:hypothetical protein